MSERTRNAREIRIVPGLPNSAAAGTRTASPSAVQMFRSLAAQASALASAIAAQPDELPAQQPESGEPEVEAETSPLHDAAGGLAGPPAPPTPPTPFAPFAPADTAEHDDRPAATASRPAGAAAKAKTAEQGSTPDEETALGEHIVRACTTAAHGEVLAQQLADRIARFCSLSGASDDAAWEVTLPMNPAVLPDTLLHLQLSPSRIAIRFETSSTRSAGLIYDNVDRLRTRLSDALRRQVDVDVVA
jgi:hypothetical protein